MGQAGLEVILGHVGRKGKARAMSVREKRREDEARQREQAAERLGARMPEFQREYGDDHAVVKLMREALGGANLGMLRAAEAAAAEIEFHRLGAELAERGEELDLEDRRIFLVPLNQRGTTARDGVHADEAAMPPDKRIREVKHAQFNLDDLLPVVEGEGFVSGVRAASLLRDMLTDHGAGNLDGWNGLHLVVEVAKEWDPFHGGWFIPHTAIVARVLGVGGFPDLNSWCWMEVQARLRTVTQNRGAEALRFANWHDDQARRLPGVKLALVLRQAAKDAGVDVENSFFMVENNRIVGIGGWMFPDTEEIEDAGAPAGYGVF